jgi:fructosamine-3-kinase
MPGTFTKRSPVTPRSYPAEAAGLAWLGAAGADAAAVVEVVEVSEHHITVRRLEPVRPTGAAMEAFGWALAATHAAGADAFGAPPDGWHEDGFIGTQPLSLRPRETWGEFYAEQRLLPYAEHASRLGTLEFDDRQAVEKVCEHLRSGKFDDGAPPARIHGDLWAGNLVWTATGAVLIDPAAHGGHGLTDLAMLALFGVPGLVAVLSAYAEAASLPDGWRDLIGLHQLHPLLVHAVTHGPRYGEEAGRIAARYG